MSLFKTKNKKSWFRKKSKASKRENLPEKPNQRVISYYTASQRQLDNFERASNQSNVNAVGKRHFNRLKQTWFYIIVAAALIVVVVYLGTLSTSPHITISGSSYRSSSEYQKIIVDQFGSEIRNRFKPLLNSKLIRDKILENIPEAKEVTVKTSFLNHRAEVDLVMPKPLAVFSHTNTNSLILSERGRLLLATSQSSLDNASLPILVNKTGVEGKAGEQYMRPDEAKALANLIKQYKANGLEKVEYTLTNIPHELLAQEPGRGYYVRYILDESINKQYGALQAAQKELQKIGQTPNEYLDVRLAEKIYYR